MSCRTCGCSPCLCIPACLSDCPEVVDHSAENINLLGVGVYSGISGSTFQFKGIRSLNGTLLVTDNPANGTIDLEFQTDDVQGTATFANAAARALDVPEFAGQFGVQLDTDVPYISTGVAAGNWTNPWLFLDGKTTTLTSGATVLDLAAIAALTVRASTYRVGTWLFDDAVVWSSDCLVEFINGTQVNVQNASELEMQSGSIFDMSGNASFGATGVSDYVTGHRLKVNSATLQNQLLGGDSAQDPAAFNISDFLSTQNVQSGWGTPTGSLTRTTFNSGTVTLPQLAERVAALITDLKLVLLPAT